MKFTMNYKTKNAIDNRIDGLIYAEPATSFDPIHDIEDFEALNKYVVNHEVKRPSYGREIWQAILAHTISIRQALEYWNLCWFQDWEGVYQFQFPPFNGDYEVDEIPAPTEENFLGYIWEV